MTLLTALRGRAFALLFAGQTISRFGDAVSTIAIAWLVLQTTGSAAAMGVVLAANVLAFLAFGLVGGVVVDRVPSLAVMLVADGLRLVLTAGIAVLIAAGVAADAIGPGQTFLLGGLLSAAILSLALLSPSVRHLD